MFTTVYQQPKDMNWGQSQEERLEIVRPDLNFGSMTSEEVFFYENGFNIDCTDTKGIGHSILFSNIKFKITPSSIAKRNSDYYNYKTIGHIWEVKNSKLIKNMMQIAEKCENPGDDMHRLMEGFNKMGEKHPAAKHYILPLKDHLIEIIASDIDFKEIKRPPFEDLSYKPKDKKQIDWKDHSNWPRDDFKNFSPYKTEGLKSKVSNFKFNSAPIENFAYNKSGLEIFIDDKNEQRYKFSFNKCLKVDIMDTDVACLMANEYYQAAGYTLIQIKNSKLIEDLKKKATDPDLFKQLECSKHFVLPLRDNLIEIIAEDISIERAPDDGEF